MKILIDADACPSIDKITFLAKKNNLELILYFDCNHNIFNDYAKIKILSSSYQSVDIAIANDIKNNDLLITNDYGLALLAIAKQAKVVNHKGIIYDNENIDQLLFERHLNVKNRKQNIKTSNIKKRTTKDEQSLLMTIQTIIDKLNR
ncbi:MAG: DUF188 domain-containing protein [Bacilli bacterium]|nr:DUF188 domain-containing protein [Bacilli bacterium]